MNAHPVALVQPTMNSWYSESAVAYGCGSSIYAREDGTEVEVTAVNTSAESYQWPDKEPRGEVVRYVRHAQGDHDEVPSTGFWSR